MHAVQMHVHQKSTLQVKRFGPHLGTAWPIDCQCPYSKIAS